MTKAEAAAHLGVSLRTLQRLMSRNEVSYRIVKTPRGDQVVFEREALDRYLADRARAVLSPAVGTLASTSATLAAVASAPSPAELVEIVAARGGRECGYCGKSLERRARRLSPRTFTPHKDGPHRLDDTLAVCGACARAREAFAEIEFKAWLAERVPLVLAAESRRALGHLSEAAERGRVADLVAKLTLTLADAAQLSGLSKDYLLKAIRARKLKAAKRGRGWNVKRSDLEAWIKKL